MKIFQPTTGGGGPTPPGAVDFIQKTYAEMQTLISTDALIPGSFYWITDADTYDTDLGVIVQATSVNELSLQGSSGHLLPPYQTMAMWQPSIAQLGVAKIVDVSVGPNLANITFDNTGLAGPYPYVIGDSVELRLQSDDTVIATGTIFSITSSDSNQTGSMLITMLTGEIYFAAANFATNYFYDITNPKAITCIGGGDYNPVMTTDLGDITFFGLVTGNMGSQGVIVTVPGATFRYDNNTLGGAPASIPTNPYSIQVNNTVVPVDTSTVTDSASLLAILQATFPNATVTSPSSYVFDFVPNNGTDLYGQLVGGTNSEMPEVMGSVMLRLALIFQDFTTDTIVDKGGDVYPQIGWNGYVISDGDQINNANTGAYATILDHGETLATAVLDIIEINQPFDWFYQDLILESNGGLMLVTSYSSPSITYNIGDRAIYNGKINENLTGNNISCPQTDGSSPDWAEVTPSVAEGYIEEWDACEYDFDWVISNPTPNNGTLTKRSDRRGNIFTQNSIDSWSPAYRQTLMNNFQWGNNNVTGNIILDGSIFCINSYAGSIRKNEVSSGAEIDQSYYNDPLFGNTTFDYNILKSNAYFDLYDGKGGSVQGNNFSTYASLYAEHLYNLINGNTGIDCIADFTEFTGNCSFNTWDQTFCNTTYVYGVPGDASNVLYACRMEQTQMYTVLPSIYVYREMVLQPGLSTFQETINPDSSGIIDMSNFKYVGIVHINDDTYPVNQIINIYMGASGVTPNHDIMVESFAENGLGPVTTGKNIQFNDWSISGGNLLFEGYPTDLTIFNDTTISYISTSTTYQDYLIFRPLRQATTGNIYMTKVGGFIRTSNPI